MAETIDRAAFNDPILKAIEVEAIRAGLETLTRSLYDTLCGRVYILGPRTGYRHAFYMPAETGPLNLRNRIEYREDRLLTLGFKKHDDWQHETDRDDDGDRYIYDHYAVNRKTGGRHSLDVSSTRSDLPHDEFRLHVLLGFPSRYKIAQPGKRVIAPIDWNDLEAWVFRDDQAAVQAPGA